MSLYLVVHQRCGVDLERMRESPKDRANSESRSVATRNEVEGDAQNTKQPDSVFDIYHLDNVTYYKYNNNTLIMTDNTFIPIPESTLPRIVIVGAGFAGLEMVMNLDGKHYQVVLLDKNNYHQFQPLFYQVAMSGLEPSAIVFPIRKLLQRKKNFYFRTAEVLNIDSETQIIKTNFGDLRYDHLILAIGADTNFFGNENIAELSIPMKSVSEALYLRNRILDDLEKAVNIDNLEDQKCYLDIVIVGGGPTGVEVAGALAEMKRYIFPKDYKELNADEIEIHLLDAGPTLLGGMSEKASSNALKFLESLDVKVHLNTFVKDYRDNIISTNTGLTLKTRKVIWAAGVIGNTIKGLRGDILAKGNRIKVDEYCRVKGTDNIYALGDVAHMETKDYPNGHPQVAQVAIQMGRMCAKNFSRLTKGKSLKTFKYKDLGSMATIGKNKAVADLPNYQTSGFFAWLIWLWVHLFSLIGVKNKLLVFTNWIINYLTYNPSLRLIIKPRISAALYDKLQESKGEKKIDSVNELLS